MGLNVKYHPRSPNFVGQFIIRVSKRISSYIFPGKFPQKIDTRVFSLGCLFLFPSTLVLKLDLGLKSLISLFTIYDM